MPESRIKDHATESREFLHRTVVVALVVIVLLGTLVTRLVHLQITNHAHFITLARENRVKLVPLPPTRGLIYDRNGVALAQNRPTHSLEITPERVEDMEQTLADLGAIINISDDDLKRFHRLRKQKRRFDSVPIRVWLDENDVARFAVNRHRFPGVSIQARLLRNYPLGQASAHMLGYVSRINQQELERIDTSNYSGTSHIGKTGIEKTYEDILHGKVGTQQVEVNALGRVIRVLESQPPVPGKDLHLFLDASLQVAATKAFGGKNGAAVAIDPETGGILAMVSTPGFNPNLFVEGISTAAFNSLRNSDDKPLFDRALRGQYPPGSTIKPFMGLAGLETGTIRFKKKKFCNGYYQLPNHGHKYRDWKKQGHGFTDMKKSLVESCDVYYYELSHDLGIDKMSYFLGQFGFGRRTQVDITGELAGLLPSREWKRRSKNKSWFPGETLIVGIGQGYFLATPLQLASATASLATYGAQITPRAVQQIIDPHQIGPEPLPQPVLAQLSIKKKQHWKQIIDSMIEVVEGINGTARKIRTNQYRIAAKTGTAQVFSVKQDEEYDEATVSEKMRDHALFIAFAPVAKPKIAVAVVVEHGGHGGTAAAPIARIIMDHYLLGTTK
ncbi:Peptidoglycan D,D-transpeptidase MrdA [hydrothermal vent metagenome]|uniref:Peptidoglycan D,D-transpeptidase MrdA n=1 Tax=hydrothermal vent metagenome TaxID=652676 RepID=A0A3B1B5J9_9ZZZZ